MIRYIHKLTFSFLSLYLLLLIFPVNSAAQDVSTVTVEATGYGTNHEAAYANAQQQALRQAAAELLTASVYVKNSSYINTYIAAKPADFIVSSIVHIPYDGEKEVIFAEINATAITNSINSNAQGYQPTAPAYQYRYYRDALAAMPYEIYNAAVSLQHSIEAEVTEWFAETDHSQNIIQISANIVQNVNKVRYSETLKNLDSHFRYLNAHVTLNSNITPDKLPVNSIMLEDIDSNRTLYEFSNETFLIVHDLSVYLNMMNWSYVDSTIDVSFYNSEKERITSKYYQNTNQYFISENKDPSHYASFMISPFIFSDQAIDTGYKFSTNVTPEEFAAINFLYAFPVFQMPPKDQIDTSEIRNTIPNYKATGLTPSLYAVLGVDWHIMSVSSYKDYDYQKQPGYNLAANFFYKGHYGLGLDLDTHGFNRSYTDAFNNTQKSTLRITTYGLMLHYRYPLENTKMRVLFTLGLHYLTASIKESRLQNFAFSMGASLEYQILDSLCIILKYAWMPGSSGGLNTDFGHVDVDTGSHSIGILFGYSIF